MTGGGNWLTTRDLTPHHGDGPSGFMLRIKLVKDWNTISTITIIAKSVCSRYLYHRHFMGKLLTRLWCVPMACLMMHLLKILQCGLCYSTGTFKGHSAGCAAKDTHRSLWRKHDYRVRKNKTTTRGLCTSWMYMCEQHLCLHEQWGHTGLFATTGREWAEHLCLEDWKPSNTTSCHLENFTARMTPACT